MRSNIDNANLYSPTIKSGFRKGTSILAIAANITLVAGMPVVLGFDPGNTTRTITMQAVPTVAAGGDGAEHDIVHYGTGTGNLTILSPAAATLGTIYPGGYAKLRVINGAWVCYSFNNGTQQALNTQDIATIYSTLAGLIATQVLAVAVPYPFKLLSVGFRIRTPATTAAKAATLTGQINATPVTGGVISLTSAAATPTNTLVAGTAITGANIGAAGNTVGVLVSAVTAFAEGDGQVEFQLQNIG